MTSSAEQIRAWRGPALLSYGFRPFFLGASLWAVLSMMLWVGMLAGLLSLPTRFDPVNWHAHEFLFGYLGAVIAGFLLTAVPNWTGRLPIVGWSLGVLFALWLSGRIVVATSLHFPPMFVMAADLAMPITLGLAIAREIVAGRNWRNLPVLALLGLFAIGNATFHLEAARGDLAAQGYGLRMGLSVGLMMIALIGGRIVPSFTRNWLARQGEGRLPVPPMQRFDLTCLLVLLVALLMWTVAPEGRLTGVALALAGIAHAVRLGRWAGERTYREPLILVLHAAYAFVPIGAFAMASEAIWPGTLGFAAGQHLWMAGAIGLMTLAVMTRATLGHTGQTLTAGRGTMTIYAACAAAVVLRALAAVSPGMMASFHMLSGLAWIFAFAMFAILYGPLLVRSGIKA